MTIKTILSAILLGCVSSLSAIAQTNNTALTATPLATISNRDEASKQVGNVAIIKGKYAAFSLKNVKGMKRYAKIVLSDNSQIIVETGKKAKRKKAEYKKMLDKEVNVTGKIAEKVPLDIKGAPRLIGGFVVREAKVSVSK